MNRTDRSKPLALVSGLSLILLGCPSHMTPDWPKPGLGTGRILVDAPEVFARERLVRDRQEQEAWLRAQLAKVDSATFGVQGNVQFKSVFEQTASLGVDASPAASLAIAQAESARDGLRREQEIAELEHRLRVAELEARLEAAAEGEFSAAAESSADSTSVVDSGSPADAGGETSAPDAFELAKAGAAQLPAGVSGAAASPRDTFRDRLALREEIRQEIFEVMLDDGHDLGGNTLYQMKFDTTVLPDAEASAWAVVKVQFEDTFSDCLVGGSLREDCKKGLQRLFREAAKELLSRAGIQRLSLKHQLADKDKDKDKDKRATVLGRFRSEAVSKVTGKSMAQLVEAVEATDVASIATLPFQVSDAPFEVYPDGQRVCVRPAPSSDGGVCEGEEDQFHTLSIPDDALTKLFGLTRDQRPVSAYAVTPKESADRLSLANASRNAQQAALTAGLAVGTVGLDAALQRAAILEASAQAIQRTPLVVGFSNSEGDGSGQEGSSVGWILGPRLRWRGGEDPGFDLRHVVTRESLAAIVSVPAWWIATRVKVTTTWISEVEGTPRVETKTVQPHAIPLPGDPGEVEPYVIPLPGDAGEVINTLFPKSREPKAYIWSRPWPRLEVGRKGIFTIQGSNLWRNPLVVIGDQLADKTEVLPNMKGLLVTVNKVQAPPGRKKTDPPDLAEVYVWTSDTAEGGLNAGYVELMWPKEVPKASKEGAGFTVKSSSGHISTDDGTGIAVLEFELPTKPKDKVVKEVFIEVEGTQPLFSSSTGTCLDKTEAKVTGSCRVELSLSSLIDNTRISIKFYRKEGDKKIWHDPIEMRVVEVAR